MTLTRRQLAAKLDAWERAILQRVATNDGRLGGDYDAAGRKVKRLRLDLLDDCCPKLVRPPRPPIAPRAPGEEAG